MAGKKVKNVNVNRGISIGGNVSGATNIVAGDHNVATATNTQIQLPPPESVDMKSELAELRAALDALQSEHAKKISNALEEAEEEMTKEEPDKEAVGEAVERAMKNAEKSEGFGGIVETLKPVVTKAASWLGNNWHKILRFVGVPV